MVQNTLQSIDILSFQDDLLNWFEKNKRDLPWRQNQDPYRIWVSEIMLQQTQVDTVIPYFDRFMTLFPTVTDLAQAEEQDVLKAWEGLGYYSRARNLQHAAREVVRVFGGDVPSIPKELGALKGIGPYTRGAILSIAFDQPEPAVDGNVMRVLSRVLKIEDDIAQQKTKRLFELYVRELISHDDPSSFNQGIMELGALVCTPKAPMCMFCPVQTHCQAYAEGIEDQLPVKSRAKKKRTRHYAALLIQNETGYYIIEQRPETGLLANLWQFPMVPIDDIGMDHAENWLQAEYGLKVQIGEKQTTIKHVFTHIIWQLDVFHARINVDKVADERLTFVNKTMLETYPFPVSHQKMMPFLS